MSHNFEVGGPGGGEGKKASKIDDAIVLIYPASTSIINPPKTGLCTSTFRDRPKLRQHGLSLVEDDGPIKIKRSPFIPHCGRIVRLRLREQLLQD